MAADVSLRFTSANLTWPGRFTSAFESMMLQSGIQQREREILHIHDILEPIEEVLSEDSTLDVSPAMICHEKTMGLGMTRMSL